MALTQEQINQVRQALSIGKSEINKPVAKNNISGGISEQTKNALLQIKAQRELKEQPVEKKKGLLEGIGERRGSEVVKSIQAQQRGEQGLLSTIGQVGGQVLGGTSDVIFGTATKALSAITPDFIEKPVKELASKAVSSIFATETGKNLAEKLQQFDESDTKTTRNLKALLGAGELALDVTGVGLGTKAVEKTALKTAEKVSSKLAERQLTKLPAKVSKSEKIYERATDVAPSAKKGYETKFNESISKALLERRIFIEAEGNKLKTGTAISKIDDELIEKLETQLQQVLNTSDKSFSLENTLRKYVEKLDSSTKLEAEKSAELAKAINFIKEQTKKGFELDASSYNELKRKFNRYFDKADSAANNAARDLQSVIREEIVNAFPNNKIITTINNEYSKLLELKKALVKMNDKVVKGGLMGKKINQIIGAIAASKLPVIGPFLGYEIAGRLTDFLLNPERLTSKAISQLKKLGVVPQDLLVQEDVLKFLQQDLKKQLEGVGDTLRLPVGKTKVPEMSSITTPIGNNPNLLPYKTVIDSKASKIGTTIQPEKKQLLLPQGTGITGKTIIPPAPTYIEPKAKIIGSTVRDTVEKKSLPIKKTSKTVDTLIQEAKKYKSAEEFVEAKFNQKPEYGMSHRPSWENMPPASNLLEGDAIPKDVYEHPEWSIASGRNFMNDLPAKESWSALQKIRNKPDATITVYRAGQSDKLNIGDWITFSKNYAKDSIEGNVEKVRSYKIKARDAIFAGDDINEFGYYPKSQLTDIWNKANKKKLPKKPN